MKIVDLDTAQSLLHRSTRGPSLTQPPSGQGHKEQQPPPPPPAASHHAPPGGGGGAAGNAASSWDQYRGPSPHGGRGDERGRGGQPLPPQGDYNRMRVSDKQSCDQQDRTELTVM